MPFILAQAEAVAIDWVKVLLDRGLSFTIAAVVVFLVWKYGQRILDGHLSFMQTAKDTQIAIAESLKSLAESFRTLKQRDDESTHRALEHFANAAKEATTAAGVHRYLDKVIDELNR